ncbi:MAG: hypothetical protein QM831_09195 [Kofleriaceae bacterium]
MRWLVVCCLLACGHAPPPKPPAAQKPVNSLADVAGAWSTSDDMDWGYLLDIRPDGDVHLTIDRGKLGRCTLHATPIRGAVAPSFEMEVAIDECHRDRASGAPIYIAVPSFTGTEITLEIKDGDHVDRRTYQSAK